jgi:Na+-transporting NADH:ubiquinone oxidoreductase subunit NqrF
MKNKNNSNTTNKPLSQCAVTMLWEDKKKVFNLRRGLGFQAISIRDETSPIEFDCRKSDCGICIVRVVKGHENLSKVEEKEKDFLNAMRAEDDERLACQCRILGDVTVQVEYL